MSHHKTNLLQLIGSAELSEVFERLDQLLLHGKTYADFVHFKARHRELRSGYRKNTISEEEYSRGRNKLTDDLIEFIQDMDEREFLSQILLLSPDKHCHDQLASYFQIGFPNATAEYSGSVQQGDFAFVVCNDFYTPDDKKADFDALMQQYLDSGYYLICYTGNNQKPIVGGNRQKVHAANSPFALYARIREMIDFIRYFKP
jgi:Effector-associated domain 11